MKVLLDNIISSDDADILEDIMKEMNMDLTRDMFNHALNVGSPKVLEYFINRYDAPELTNDMLIPAITKKYEEVFKILIDNNLVVSMDMLKIPTSSKIKSMIAKHMWNK